MPSHTTVPSERGFSLIELLIAIVITLIVTGSMYGLLAQGQNAFRREPEISDRQQQIRLAMDLIQRDLTTAGMGMLEWTQVFIPGLDGIGPNNAAGVPTDQLAIVGYDGACTPVGLCVVPDGSGVVETNEPLPACYSFPTLIMTRPGLAPFESSVGVATAAGGGGAGCPAGMAVTVSALPPAPPYTWNVDNDATGAVLQPPGFGDMRPIQLVLYRIYVDANGIPSLWRSAQGGFVLPGGAGPVDPGAGSDWQLVATGIEDLQVQYRDGNAAWLDSAPAINPGTAAANWASLVREVKVTLGARTTGQQILQGESVSATGVRAIRGQLTSVTVPRAALGALSAGVVPVAQRWN